MSKHAFGVVTLLVAATGCGLSGLLTRGASRVDLLGSELVAGQSIGAALTVGRLGAAFVLFCICVALSGALRGTVSKRPSAYVVAGGFMLGVSLALYQVSSLLIPLANAVFLIYTGPLFCIVLACVLRGERLGISQVLCVMLVFSGMLLVSGVVSITQTGLVVGNAEGMRAGAPEGYLLGLLSGALYGGSLFCNGFNRDVRSAEDFTCRGFWYFLSAVVGSAVITALLMHVWPLGEAQVQPVNLAFAAAMLVACGAIGCGALLLASRYLPTIEYTTLAYWECIVASIVSILVFREPMSASLVVGGFLVVAGGLLPLALRDNTASPKRGNSLAYPAPSAAE